MSEKASTLFDILSTSYIDRFKIAYRFSKDRFKTAMIDLVMSILFKISIHSKFHQCINLSGFI